MGKESSVVWGKGLMAFDAWRNLCISYTIIFYGPPVDAFTWSLLFYLSLSTRAQLSLTVYEIALIAH